MSVPRAPTSKASSRPLGNVDAVTYQQSDFEKLLALDAAFKILRHVNSVGAERLLDELDAEVHLNTLYSASYTSFADAATCAATAAPAPVNELADSPRY